jgi:hypothetical protein
VSFILNKTKIINKIGGGELLVAELYSVFWSWKTWVAWLGFEVPSLFCSHPGSSAARTEHGSQMREQLLVQFLAPPVVCASPQPERTQQLSVSGADLSASEEEEEGGGAFDEPVDDRVEPPGQGKQECRHALKIKARLRTQWWWWCGERKVERQRRGGGVKCTCGPVPE